MQMELSSEPYQHIWWEPEVKDYCMNTRNPDGTVRDLDWMTEEFKRFFKLKRNMTELHDWGGSATAGCTCRKCGSWSKSNWNLPERGCTPARPELSTALRII